MEITTLSSFNKEILHTPPLEWFGPIKKETDKRIIESPFAEACRMGNRDVMRQLVIDLWPFVDVFPSIVGRKYVYLFTNPLMYFKHGYSNMLSLTHQSIAFLKSIERDEKSHRLLWLDIGSALGLEYPKDYGYLTTETRMWKEEVLRQVRLSEMFFGYVAIEIIAESISKELIKAEPFKKLLGDKGLRWFFVHAKDHGDVSHENLELRLALAFLSENGPTSQQIAENRIMAVVNKFLAAANTCVQDK